MNALLFHKFRTICIKTILWTRNTNCFTIFVHANFRRKSHPDCDYHIVPRPRKWGSIIIFSLVIIYRRPKKHFYTLQQNRYNTARCSQNCTWLNYDIFDTRVFSSDNSLPGPLINKRKRLLKICRVCKDFTNKFHMNPVWKLRVMQRSYPFSKWAGPALLLSTCSRVEWFLFFWSDRRRHLSKGQV